MKKNVTCSHRQAMRNGLSSLHFLVLFLVSLFSLPAMSQSPAAPALGFNVFLQKGATLISNETEGPVAMGGDLTLSQGGYQVSTNYIGSFKVNNVPVTLVVGGKVNYSGGNGLSINQNGYIKIGAANGSKAWYTDQNNAYSPIRVTPGSDYNGSPRINLQANAQQLGVSESSNPVFQSGVIDFDAAFTKLKASSLSLGACTDNASLTDPNGNAIAHTNLPNQVKINLHTGTNTLNLAGNDLNAVQVFTYNNAPDANHILVINVNAPGTFNWNVYNSAGIGFQNCPYVLYNFYNTTTLNIQAGAAIEGTVFAPYADIIKTGNQSNIEGQIIAQSYVHSGGENHYAVFAPSVSGCGVVCNLSISGVKTDITCHGSANGAINITASGNNGTVSYLWNDNITTEDRTGLAAGSYSVQATDAGGCKATSETFVIGEPAAISVSGTTTNVSTAGGSNGSINVSVSGGTAPYAYKWNDGVTLENRTGLPAGTYSVTVTDKNGCSCGKAFTITAPVCNLTVTGKITPVTCYGGNNGAIDLTATGNNGLVTYLWNDGATTEDRTGLIAGNYSVKATDAAGCSATCPKIVVTQPTKIKVTATVTGQTTTGVCNGTAKLSATGGTAPYTYTWSDGYVGANRTGLCMGAYKVMVSDKKGCCVSYTVTIACPDKAGALVSDLAASSLTTSITAGVTLAPNPTMGLIKVTLTVEKAGTAMITVYDLTGKALIRNQMNLSVGTNQQQVNLSSLAKGLYEVQVSTSEGAKIFKVILN